MQNLRFFLVSCVLFCCASAFAWDNAGHKVVAKIAYDRLTPTAKARVDNLSALLAPKDWSALDRFYYLATWPDVLAHRDDVKIFNNWHFYDEGFSFEGVEFPAASKTANIAWVEIKSVDVLTGKNSDNAEKAIFLSFVVHLVGDVHQPLHCATRYSSKHQRGDFGGNGFEIDYDEYTPNLHSLWDKGLGLILNHDYERHTDDDEWVATLATEFTAAYPEQSLAKADDLNVYDWVKESNAAARQYAYVGIEEGGKPTAAYIAKGREVVKQRLVLAGYRLAKILNGVFAA